MRTRTPFVIAWLAASSLFIVACGSGGTGTTPAVNLGPAFSSTPVLQASVNVPYSYRLTATDDGPTGALRFELVAAPGWLVLTGNGDGSATLSGIPDSGDAGLFTVSVRVSDSGLPPASATQSFEITVGPANQARDFRDEVIYFAMTDRFLNGDPLNDNGNLVRLGDTAAPDNPRGWHGGDFAGLRKKAEEGYFSTLGFTALWISPVVLQVPAVDNGNFSGFHGYWAEDFRRIEPHFGSLRELRELADALHQRGIKLIIDVVVNHAGYEADLVSAMPDWFRTGAECGSSDFNLCLAGLPDFIQENVSARQYLDESVRWLINETGLDGLRMDTMKHVPDSYWSDFFAAGGAGDPTQVWTVGEVFSGSVSQLAHYLDTLGSPSVFDFALYFAIDKSLARGASINELAAVLSADGQYEDATRLATFVDNHDVPRFMTASLDAGHSQEQAMQRLDLALSFIYLARGIPVVYYGSEIAMTGGGDPDNRKDMNFAALAGSSLDERLAALGQARRAYAVLRRGDQQLLWPPGAASCTSEETSLNAADAYGMPVYLRGSFEGWMSPPGTARLFRNRGAGIFEARADLRTGTHAYKIASADWEIERAVVGMETLLDSPQPLSIPPAGDAGNGQINISQDGCYAWTIAVQNSTSSLTVSRAGETGQLLAFARTLTGENAVIAVLNNTHTTLDLAALPGRGLPVTGLLADGAALVEVTGKSQNFSVLDGLLTGSLAPGTIYAITTQ